jgi:hypothetical protein
MIQKETLEEVAQKHAKKHYGKWAKYDRKICKEDFKAGAKWQSERMYTEEEVESLLHKFMQSQHPDWHGYSTTKWFEQHKKK